MACVVCGVEVWKPEAWLRRVKRPTCSRKCNGILRGAELKKHAHKGRAAWSAESEAALRERMSGPNNPAWKGGKAPRQRLYRYVRCPAEFLQMARPDGWVQESRLVVAQTIGRCLSSVEVVHHENKDTKDNRPENLMLFATNADHLRYEMGDRTCTPIWSGLRSSSTAV